MWVTTAHCTHQNPQQVKVVAADTDFYDSLDIKQRRPKHVHTYLSLQIFNPQYFGDYDMLAFMDVDVFPVRNVDEAFCTTGKFSAVVRETAGSDWRKSGFNSGFYVYRADRRDFKGLVAAFKKHINQESVTLGVQGVLNTYFRKGGFFCLPPAFNCLGIMGPPAASRVQSSKCSFNGEDEIFSLGKGIVHTKLSMLKYARWMPRVIELWAQYLHPDARGRLPTGHPHGSAGGGGGGGSAGGEAVAHQQLDLKEDHIAQSCYDLAVSQKQFRSSSKTGFFASHVQGRLLSSLHGALVKLRATTPSAAALQVVFSGSSGSSLLESLRRDPVFRQPAVSIATVDEPDLGPLLSGGGPKSLVLVLDLSASPKHDMLTSWAQVIGSASSSNIVAVVAVYSAEHRRALQGSGSPVETLESSAAWMSGLGFNPYLAGSVSLLPLGKHCWKSDYEICGVSTEGPQCQSVLLGLQANDIDMIFQVKYNTYARPS